jgi:ribosomal-protein-alanine N-acetyltransferase
MVLFETDRMIVKRFNTTDAEFFFQVNGSAEVMAFVRPAKNRAESDVFLRENIRFYRDSSALGRFAVFAKDNGRFLGTFSFLYLAGEADFHLGYALLPSEWGNGFATELVRSGAAYFFARTDNAAIFALTLAENLASQRVLAKAGFLHQKRFEENGKTIDVFYINRSLDPPVDIQNK